MALVFPINPSVGQTYQSGSSPIFTFNGSVWSLSAGNVGISGLNAYTASLKTAIQLTGSNATMLGNLNVQGTQTALNQASLQISDKTIRIASGSTTSVQSNGAGLLIDGAGVTMSWDSTTSQLKFNTEISASKFVGDGSGLVGVTSYTNSDNLAYLNSKGVVSGSSQVSSLVTSLNVYTGSNTTNINALHTSTASLNTFTSSINSTIKSKLNSDGVISGSSQVLNGSGIWSGSSQLPSGLISGSSQLPSGLVSGSSQVLNGSNILSSSAQTFTAFSSSIDSRVGVGSAPAGTVSGSTQITTLGFLATSSFNTYTSSVSNAISGAINSATASLSASNAVIDGLQLATASFNTYTSSINTFTASVNTTTASLNGKTGSYATTGSNQFKDNQTITGSLTVTALTTISSSISANSSSLYLTSGSNIFVQNNGLVEITGSINLSGSLTIKSGSITMQNRPAFRVIGNASTERTTGLILSSSIVSVDYNEGSYYNTSNGKFTAPIAGLYQVFYNGRVGGTNSAMQVIIYKNTNVVQLMWETAGNTGATHFGVSGIVKLAVNDTLEAKVTVGSIQFDGNDSWGATYIG